MKPIFSLFIAFFIIISCNKKAADTTNASIKTDTILQKDGKILTYNVYEGTLMKAKRDRTIYNEKYLKRIGKLVEYYLDKTTLNSVKSQLENPNAKLGYSIEQTEWEGVIYTQIGLYNRPKDNIYTFLWLFYNPKTQQLYEFDVPKNKPILFQFK